MKYLITICITAIAIAFLFCAAWSDVSRVREEGRLRAKLLSDYARRHAPPSKPGPTVETPTEKKQSFTGKL